MSKSCVTMMLCGSADGTLLPPFIIYKSDNLYTSWIQGGPKGDPCCHFCCCKNGTQFHNTASGWMDTNAFQKWFSELLLPHLQNLDGPKAVIGDNLSAHFSETVLKLAEDNDTKFICLPPNSTDKTQPLDVTFFEPMKKAWKHVLEEFKVENPYVSIVNKQVFPKQVNKLFKHPSFYPNIEKNLKSGFRGTGIFPLDIINLLFRLGNTRTGKDATPVLSRATSSTTSSSLVIEESPEASSLSNTFVNYLEEKKFPKCARGAHRGGRGAKIQAGTRVVSTINQDEAEVSGQSTFDMHPSTSKDPFAYAVQKNVKRKLDLLARRDNAESESTDMDTDQDSEETNDVRPTHSRSARVLTPMLSPAGTPSKVQKEIPSPTSGTPTTGTPAGTPSKVQKEVPSPSSGAPTAGNTSDKVKPTPTKKLKTTAPISATDEGSCTSTITKSSALKVGSFVITKVYVNNSSDKHRKYLATVDHFDETEVSVTFLHASESKIVFTVAKDDTASVEMKDICEINDVPYKFNSREQYVFNAALDVSL
ncbi:uncharacterized protein LOC108667548 [Hyalella azteca]|uniref:Uncharacterized protein LOC108667548 n=1 Tax=Hyalella azteca TaxID=294128 RepID=A0A8B7N843_HYAAZ|nr:uncharacterized protein LOC108667548 [Hyalella azteca]